MNLSITVVFPKPIQMTEGTIIEADGKFTYADRLMALTLTDKTRDRTYTATPDDVPELLNYRGPMPYTTPLVGEVISHSYYNGSTQINLFPTNQTLYNYNMLYQPMHKLSVPAFWKVVEQQRGFEKRALPQSFDLYKIRNSLPQLYDASETVTKVFAYFQKKRRFHVARCVRYLWGSLEKLYQTERHLERLKAIDDLRIHLFASSRSEGREFLLRETEIEAGLVVEAAASTTYSSLDLLGHVINEVYELGMANNYANFMNTVTAKSEDSRSLAGYYPDGPLTVFLLQQRNGWIRELEAWRHYSVHHGVLRVGNFIDDGVIIMPPETEDELLRNMKFETDATAIVTGWTADLRALLLEAFRLIGERVDEQAALPDDVLAVGKHPIALFQTHQTPALEHLLRFLELWQSDESEEPKKYEHMTFRLHPSWRKEWPFQKFSDFIKAHPLMSYDFAGGVSSGTNRPSEVSVRMKFRDREMKWGFTLERYQNRFVLARTPFSTPASFIKRLDFTGLGRRQSGVDSGYRDVVFFGKVQNNTDTPLNAVTLHVFLSDFCGATLEVGILAPGEQQDFAISWIDGCIPPDSPGSSIAIPSVYNSAGISIRVIYQLETPEGNVWAEDAYLR